MMSSVICIFTRCNNGGLIKGKELGVARIVCGKGEKCIQNFNWKS